jgi:hypothetical protein
MTDEHIDAELPAVLEQLITEHRFDVVILDPWATYYAGNESSNDEVEAALDKLRGVTLTNGTTWVIFHHIGKSLEHREPEDAWRGASRLADWASTRVTIMPHYNERQRISKGLTRRHSRAFVDVFMLRRSDPTDDFSLHRGDDGWWTLWEPDETDEALDGHGTTTEPGRPPTVTLREFVNELATAGGEWASITEAADTLGISRRAAQRLATEAENVELVTCQDGERQARRITLTDLGREKADRFVSLETPEIESRAPVARTSRAHMRENPAQLDTRRSDPENDMREIATCAKPRAAEKPQVRASRAVRENPLLRREGDPHGSHPHDNDDPWADF